MLKDAAEGWASAAVGVEGFDVLLGGLEDRSSLKVYGRTLILLALYIYVVYLRKFELFVPGY